MNDTKHGLKRLKREDEINYPLSTSGMRIKKGSAIYAQIWKHIYWETEQIPLPPNIETRYVFNQIACRFRARRQLLYSQDELYRVLEYYYSEGVYRLIQRRAKRIENARSQASQQKPVTMMIKINTDTSNPDKMQTYFGLFRSIFDGNEELENLVDLTEQFYSQTGHMPTPTELDVYIGIDPPALEVEVGNE